MSSKENNAFLNGFIKAAVELPVPPKALSAEWLQESSGSHNWGITGDHGKALGPLQIHLPMYRDATNYNPSLASHPYSFVTNLPFANQIYGADQNKYNLPALKALQSNPGDTNALKELFALWHGGPAKYKTPGTTNYVNEALQKYLKLK